MHACMHARMVDLSQPYTELGAQVQGSCQRCLTDKAAVVETNPDFFGRVVDVYTPRHVHSADPKT